ncbi:hypothetical protein KAJ27_22545 [bacterium]|nr:hypothetical protein [bacterium]
MNHVHSKSRDIARIALFSTLGLVIIALGPLVKSFSFGFPGGFLIFPILINYLILVKEMRNDLVLWVAITIGFLGMWCPFFGGFGLVSLFIGTITGILVKYSPTQSESMYYKFISVSIISALLFTMPMRIFGVNLHFYIVGYTLVLLFSYLITIIFSKISPRLKEVCC